MRQRLVDFYSFLDSPLAWGSRWVLAILVVPLLLTFTAPLWQISMEAPQYPEGLQMDIYAYKLEGTYDIIVKVESDSVEQFAHAIGAIRKIPNILNTDTIVGFK